MIVSFSVGNFRSIREPVTLDLQATKLTSKDKRLDENNVIKANAWTRVLKSVFLYGANASGKSNILYALGFFARFVRDSSKSYQEGEKIPYEPFRLDRDYADKGSFFECVFVIKTIKYRYGFELSDNAVLQEWLYVAPKIKEYLLFSREGNIFETEGAFKEADPILRFVRRNSLLISTASQFNNDISKDIVKYIGSFLLLSGIDNESRMVTARLIDHEDAKGEIVNFLKNSDIGFDDVKLDNIEGLGGTDSPDDFKRIEQYRSVKVKTIHNVYSDKKIVGQVEFDLDDHESRGTRKLFALAGLVVIASRIPTVVLLDEIDAQLHPILTDKIIGVFNSQKNSESQLIAATHDVNLLRPALLRRDQIWFTQKDKSGATDLFTLADFKIDGKKIRNDKSYEKAYISGRFGAIPYVKDLNMVFENHDEIGKSDAKN